MLLEQVAGLNGAIERRCVRDRECTVVNEDAILNDVVRFALHKLAIGAEQARARFIESEREMAEEDWSLDDGRRVGLEPEPHGVHGGERLAGDAVGAELNGGLDGVCEPALADASLIDVALYGFQLLSPVGGGVGEVLMSIGGTAPEFVGVRDIGSRERSQR